MSRYGFPDQSGGDIVVGWDPPLSTLFVQGKFSGPDDEPGVWHGISPREIQSVPELYLIVRRELGVEMSESIQNRLVRDQLREPGRYAPRIYDRF